MKGLARRKERCSELGGRITNMKGGTVVSRLPQGRKYHYLDSLGLAGNIRMFQ